MRKKLFIFVVFLILIAAGMFFFVIKSQSPEQNNNKETKSNNQNISKQNSGQQVQITDNNQPQLNSEAAPQFNGVKKQTVNPIEGAISRITKKPFGIFITPKNSPINPERFQGYHTAVDLETNPDEQNIEVAVKALCDGKLLVAKTASGYGGVVVQSCMLDGKDVTVVYGHINIASVKNKVGDQMKAGDFLANLGKGFSSQTDGERKHLHLGIYTGKNINILGYVQNKADLGGWIDPIKYLQ